jgi:hypothetical protein
MNVINECEEQHYSIHIVERCSFITMPLMAAKPIAKVWQIFHNNSTLHNDRNWFSYFIILFERPLSKKWAGQHARPSQVMQITQVIWHKNIVYTRLSFNKTGLIQLPFQLLNDI